MVGLEGKELGGMSGPHLVQKTSMPSHHMACLPTMHHPMWRTLSVRMLITPLPYSLRTDNLIMHMGDTYEIPHHNLADFEPCLGYATEGQVVGGILLQNTLEDPRFRPQPQPLHSTAEYAQRWRDLAAQVVPSMTEKEMITMIVDTLPVFYYERWWVTHLQSFADLVFAGKRIEVGLKKGKFDHPTWTNEKTGANEEGENEGETHAVTAIPIQPSFPPAQQCHYSANNNPSPYLLPSYP
ncbi:hypothetical protein GmHk_12G034934 [Glycine max]|nr:hypothetical protein GmHk_12G034934 [Glycine max]